MKLATFCLLLFLSVYHLNFHSDGALGDQTSAKVGANNCRIEKGNAKKVNVIYQTRDSVSSRYQNTEKRVDNTTRIRVFLTILNSG